MFRRTASSARGICARTLLVAVAVAVVPALGADSRSVCEVLSELSGLNGKDVSVTGVWNKGHIGQQLWAAAPCPATTIRDGWEFADGIRIAVDKRIGAGSSLFTEMREFQRNHPGTVLIATLKGRLEAPEHFETWADLRGMLHVRSFGDFAAEINVWAIASLSAITYSPQDLAAAIRVRSHLGPERVQDFRPENKK